MGFWKNAALLATGALTGYLATRKQPQSYSGQVERQKGDALKTGIGGETAMTKFFDSVWGRPLQPYALKAIQFAARVKSGMDEKEAELHQKFEKQKQDIRPGSIDTWASNTRVEGKQGSIEGGNASSMSARDSSRSHGNEQLHQRIIRDRELGPHFFD